jgi:hypothetical protein
LPQKPAPKSSKRNAADILQLKKTYKHAQQQGLPLAMEMEMYLSSGGQDVEMLDFWQVSVEPCITLHLSDSLIFDTAKPASFSSYFSAGNGYYSNSGFKCAM